MSDKNDLLVITIGDHEQIAGAIVETAAAQLLCTFAGSDEDGDPHYKNSALASMLNRKITEAVHGYVKDIVERHAREILARGVPRVNAYGERVGKNTVTVAELIHEKLRHELIDRKSGRGTKDETVLNRIIGEEVDKALSRELHEEIKAAKERVKSAIAAEAAKLLTEAVVRQVGA